MCKAWEGNGIVLVAVDGHAIIHQNIILSMDGGGSSIVSAGRMAKPAICIMQEPRIGGFWNEDMGIISSKGLHDGILIKCRQI